MLRSGLAAITILVVLTPLFGDEADKLRELSSRIQPLLKTHCLDCHSGHEPDAGLALDNFDKPLAFLKGRSVWEKAIQKLQLDEMPPPDSSSLSTDDRSYLIQWLTTTINDYACGLQPNPGQVTLRRLNASEYQNTVRDLIGVNYSPAEGFPGDDVGYGFDNIGDVLTLPPLLMEKYLIAAEKISRYAIQTPQPAKLFEATYAGGQLQVDAGASSGSKELVLASAGTAKLREQVPWAGLFQLTISAAGDQAGSEPCAMAVSVDGKVVKRIAVPNERNSPGEFMIPLKLRAGNREIAIAFLNDFYVAAQGDQPQQDRNLIIHHVSLTGKQATQEKLDPTKLSKIHQQILFTDPQKAGSAEAATRQVLERFASRAFRRAAESEDVDRLVALAMSIQDDGDSFEESIQVALQAVLISSKFLFRVEPPSASVSLEKYRDLDEFELASRLSYFLWSTMPDDELFKLAWSKQLRHGDNLSLQIKRMINDPKSNSFIENFAGQWLTLRKLKNFQPNAELFPNWNDRVRSLVERETLTFFAGVMRRDMSVMRLLDAEFTYLNEELANYYGIPNVQGEQFRPVSLKGTGRAGLLTQASVLAVTSNPTRTSPVKRGKWILENLLATPPPPAPPGVPELKEKGELTGTLRQRLEQHRADAACAGCHRLMDPLGFALENFDAVGRFRQQDHGQPIDARGELPDGTSVNGAAELRNVLVEKNQAKFVECLTEKMLTYALGRGLEYYDKCAVDKIVAQMDQADYKFSTLLLEIVKSDPFQKKGVREFE